jgi:hypothetical protein
MGTGTNGMTKRKYGSKKIPAFHPHPDASSLT